MLIKIGTQIRALRKQAGMTQEALAEAIGVTAQAISKWESEAGYPDIEYIPVLANLFAVDIDTLFAHDASAHEAKIARLCADYDAATRTYAAIDERIAMMREAIAAYPGDDRLLIRLADALTDRWVNGLGWDNQYQHINGKWVYAPAFVRATTGYQEPLAIAERIYGRSTDPDTRRRCRAILRALYANLAEKEKLLALSTDCTQSPDDFLYGALSTFDDPDARMYSQRLLMYGEHLLRVHLPAQTRDPGQKEAALKLLISLNDLIFGDTDRGFYHSKTAGLYTDLANLCLRQNRPDEAIDALETAVDHTAAFDRYLAAIRATGSYAYASPFLDAARDEEKDITATPALPELLERTLLDENDTFWKKLHDDPRYLALIARVQTEVDG